MVEGGWNKVGRLGGRLVGNRVVGREVGRLVAELQKANRFTLADFLGLKNLDQKCVIHDKFNATKSA